LEDIDNVLFDYIFFFGQHECTQVEKPFIELAPTRRVFDYRGQAFCRGD
jgi:hypothetical protein